MADDICGNTFHQKYFIEAGGCQGSVVRCKRVARSDDPILCLLHPKGGSSMKKHLVLFFGLILLLGLCSVANAADPIEIALLCPLSGPLADPGNRAVGLGVDGIPDAMNGKRGPQNFADGDHALAAKAGDADFKARLSCQRLLLYEMLNPDELESNPKNTGFRLSPE
jgi:hypothetical protein